MNGNRNPFNGTFELTVRCNFSCKMCLFRHHDRENQELQQKELTTAQWIDLAKQAADAGTLTLLITGGEPLLRKDFCEIWEGIYRLGFILNLYTNASLVDDRIMQTLSKYPPHKIGITLYGASAETYEKVCGNASGFQRTMDGIHRLQKLPSRLSFRTTIIEDNYEDYEKLYRLIQSEFGPQYDLVHTRLVTQSVRGACADVNTCSLKPGKNVTLAYLHGLETIRQKAGKDFDIRNIRIEPSETEDTCRDSGNAVSLFGCNGGMTDYCITYDGKLQSCQMFGYYYTDVLQSGFLSAWERYPQVVENRKQPEGCERCADREYCASCIASLYAETGQLQKKSEYVCEDAALLHRLVDGRILQEGETL